ncbi:hypothetical protein [Rhizobium sp. Leaf391]|uniref:hypothetical protein n=1 Tax=Rhizobium sp. Leaf391 TaxID=1736360 RepID=UPI0012E3D22F|nr:hypothetical protein [Rhizobium sp. Leaf391]
MGYEVDGLVDNAGEKFLLEIKTTVLASDVYTGVGQLHLYDQPIPGVKGARKILLLPGTLGEEIKAAVSSTGIVVLAYDMRYHNDRLMITFPEETRLFSGSCHRQRTWRRNESSLPARFLVARLSA